MKAIVQAISLVIAGLGSAVAMALTPVARDPYLVALYASLSVAMAITTAVFWWLFHKDDKAEAIESDHGLGVDGTADNENGGFRRPLEESILRAGPRPPSQNSTVRVSMQQELDVLEPRATAASNNTADIHGTPPLPPVRALQDTIWGTLGKAT
jgi:POT family proton-dependent oligopeptide transporter